MMWPIRRSPPDAAVAKEPQISALEKEKERMKERTFTTSAVVKTLANDVLRAITNLTDEEAR